MKTEYDIGPKCLSKSTTFGVSSLTQQQNKK